MSARTFSKADCINVDVERITVGRLGRSGNTACLPRPRPHNNTSSQLSTRLRSQLPPAPQVGKNVLATRAMPSPRWPRVALHWDQCINHPTAMAGVHGTCGVPHLVGCGVAFSCSSAQPPDKHKGSVAWRTSLAAGLPFDSSSAQPPYKHKGRVAWRTSLAAGLPFTGMRALMPPMACTLRLWHVWITSCGGAAGQEAGEG